ncbi:MAG TPA: carboxypeptidase regulatory-like domain-containing protein [Bryobacteraceae bacterium]|nr:carboxypeptidase regulatory-like domain-containing protein [Bryobacteraceae bacterium]
MLILASAGLVMAQLATGTISGTVTDESGAVIPNATVTATNRATNVPRTATTNAEGFFSIVALPAGDYDVKTEVKGFKTVVRPATVQAGESTTVNMPMTVGQAQEVVTVEAASAQMNYDTNNIQGVIPRSNIEDLPLNGRSYLQLAELEPGIQIGIGSVAQFNALFTVSVLGAGNRTVVTVDGGNVSDNIDVGGGMSSMNFPQDTVQEFQLSEVNFDISTPIAAGGAINMVTRSGSNDWHGSAYMYYRDHNMAAYPNLQRVAGQSSPFFERKNPGASLGGPIKKDRLFFFFNYEYFNQVQAVAIATTDPAFAAFDRNYNSPYVSKDLTFRLDYHLNDKNNLFLRYSHDGNAGFGVSLIGGDPSTWAHNTNWADQGILGWTSSITAAIVNSVTMQYNYWGNHNFQAVPSDCASPCAAGVLPTIYTVVGASSDNVVGPNFNAPQARNTRRFEPIENLSWQKGTHQFKFGGDLNLTGSVGLWGFCTPMCVGAFSPSYIKALGATALFPGLPSVLTNATQFLNLPVYNGGASIFSGVGVGVNSTPGAYNYSQNIWYNQYRTYFQDVWKIKPNFTLNYGLAWNAQTGFYPQGVNLPQYLEPILGSNLGPTANNTKEMQPAFGFAWSPFKDNKTVIRGGGGIYWDSTPGYYKLRSASSIEPPGSNRETLAASAFSNIYPGLINLNTGTLIPVGSPLPIGGLTTMTVGQFVNLVNQELPSIAAVLAPTPPQRSGPFQYPTINYAKQGVEIYPHSFPLARSYQTSLGVQRELPGGWVISADWARRQGENVSLGELDWNLYNRFEGSRTPVPVIPLCKTTPDLNPADDCSSGAITIWTDEGRAIYEGLLAKATKRMSHRFQATISYAYAHAYTDNVDVWNAVNYVQSGWGQYLPHQNLNIAGTGILPWGLTLSINSSMITTTPATPSISTSAGAYFPGTVPTGGSEPLPGVGIGALGSGITQSGLAAVVNAYNTNYVGKIVNTQGTVIPDYVVLPKNYALGGAPTISQDFRLTKTIKLHENYALNVFVEMFNAFNISNLAGYTGALDVSTNPNAVCAQGVAVGGNNISCQFGQATSRQGQTFGSAGARDVQVGARFTF